MRKRTKAATGTESNPQFILDLQDHLIQAAVCLGQFLRQLCDQFFQVVAVSFPLQVVFDSGFDDGNTKGFCNIVDCAQFVVQWKASDQTRHGALFSG